LTVVLRRKLVAAHSSR